VVIGAWLTSKRERLQRRLDFVARQLREFYSPLLALRSEIKIRGELRLRIHNTADTIWRKLCEEAGKFPNPDEVQRKLSEERFPEFQKLIEHDNRKFSEETLPTYRRMVTIFRENMMLAESDTQPYFEKLLEFVDLWDRWMEKSIPREVIELLDQGEAPLQPFYRNLQENFEKLRTRYAKGEE